MIQHKWACILNPVAGNGYASENIEMIRNKVREIDGEAPIVQTERVGHATELAETLLSDGYDTILVAGGDGTVHEVGSVMVGRKDIAMGIISCGSGNDYNFMAGFPERFAEKHWAALKSRTIKSFDVGICNGQFFFNGMGLGFDATMTAESNLDREKTGKSGKGRYTWIIIKTLFGYKELERVMSIDEVSQERASFLTTIAIGRRFAGSYLLTPLAVVDDGLLDICDIDPLSLINRLKILLKVPKGSHLGEPSVHYSRCRKSRITFAKTVPAHLDGELIFNSEFDISIQEKSLNIITNM